MLRMVHSNDYLERLVDSGLDTRVVSIDGATAETYVHYRRRGDYSLVRRNMLRIQEAKRRLGRSTPTLVAQFLVFGHNEHELDRVRAEYRDWGADSLRIGTAGMPMEPYREGFEPPKNPEFDLYHPDHPWQTETRRRLGEDRPCSWLYGVFLMNPNGKVSPCCGTAAEGDDFADYSPERGVAAAWNSERFRRARALFTRVRGATAGEPGTAAVADVMRRFDGLTTGSLAGAELICQRCPIVFMQDTADAKVADLARIQALAVVRRRSLRDLAALVLMGLPVVNPDWLRAQCDPGSSREVATARALGIAMRAAETLRSVGVRALRAFDRSDRRRVLPGPLEPEQLHR